MKYIRLLSLVATLCCGAVFSSRAQSMVPIIQATQTTIGQIEKDGDVVDVALYDYIFQSNNSTFTYEYQFYANNSYTIRVLGDATRSTNLSMKVYRYVSNSWQVVKQVQATGKAYGQLPYKSTATERCRIELSFELTGGNSSSCFGMIIVREE